MTSPAFLLPVLLPSHRTISHVSSRRPLRKHYVRCSVQQHPRDESLHWKDRVALYAQFSAEETLDVLLHALQSNARTGPRKDDGIDALYAFANLDIWALTHRFFGKKMDLGQFERFKRVIVASPYDILLRDHQSNILSALHVTPDVYVTRRAFEIDGVVTVFTFTMSRTAFGGQKGRAWMVDSIIHQHNTVQ